MEIWFGAAVGGAVLAGVSNFYFKQAAARGYNAELFSLYGSAISIPIVIVGLLLFNQPFIAAAWAVTLVLVGGMVASLTNIFKVYALRYIDSTIYFPLFKLLAPALAIVAGVVFFSETFSAIEWLGMLLGLFVPLLLITKVENSRQQNLAAGIILVVVTGVLSAGTAVINKLATDLEVPYVTILLYASLGVFLGTVLVMIYKKGLANIVRTVKSDTSTGLIVGAAMRSSLITFSLGLMLYAYTTGGTLAIVQTIHSLYILIPIVLSIVLYNEHWNAQKLAAVILSVAALALLG